MDVSWMYERGARGGNNKPVPPSSHFKLYIIIGISAGAIILGGALVYFISRTPETITPVITNPEEECSKIISRAKDGEVVVSICVRKDGSLVLLWENLSGEARKIQIYRKENGSNELTLWQTVEIPNGSTSGSLVLGSAEESENYSYEFQAISINGQVVWKAIGINQSPGNTGATPGGSSSNNPPTGTSGSNQNQNPNQPNNPTTPTTPTNPDPTPTPPPPTTSTEQGEIPGYIYYYNPAGEVTGTSTPQTASFWVFHVNKKIEIGWQSLPATTNKIIILRSKNETSGYANLLEQNFPITDQPSFIRLDDNTLNEEYYYKMEAKNDSSPLQTYGPILLNPLS